MCVPYAGDDDEYDEEDDGGLRMRHDDDHNQYEGCWIIMRAIANHMGVNRAMMRSHWRVSWSWHGLSNGLTWRCRGIGMGCNAWPFCYDGLPWAAMVWHGRGTA